MSGRAWVAVCVLLLSLVAHAGEDKERAREHFRKGSQHFRLGEFSEALTNFKEAYRAVEDPSILYNIAQCHRQLNQKADAIRFYKMYLSEVPRASNREDVRRLIVMLENAAAQEHAARTTPPDGVLTRVPPPVVVTPEPKPVPRVETAVVVARAPERRTPAYKKWWLWTVVGGGVAVVALGVGLGVGLAPGPQAPAVNAPDGVFRF